MKKYLYFYLMPEGLHVVTVDSDCTPNACKKAREIALPHDHKLSCCYLKGESPNITAILVNLKNQARLHRDL